MLCVKAWQNLVRTGSERVGHYGTILGGSTTENQDVLFPQTLFGRLSR